MAKRVLVLGSTGSIGRNTLDVLRHLPDEWTVAGLAAASKYEELAAQAEAFRPGAIGIVDGRHVESLRSNLSFSPTIFGGSDALIRLVEDVPCDCIVFAMVGSAGLRAVLRAVELGRRIALANKEALVMAGSLLIPQAEQTGATILPIDSEHSAIFQAMQAGRVNEVRKVYLTASGGPFREWSVAELAGATLADALNHPTWNMGPKVTIDSATMMNKALEIVEACWLFGLRPDQVGVVVHPESIIHSLVEFCDGSMIAQLGTPDMRTPIQYALTYPERRRCPSKALDLPSLGRLHLEEPDVNRFPSLRLGYEVARRGGTCGAVLNAANESAVQLFRDGEIHYLDIARHAERVLGDHEFKANPTLEDLMNADRWARAEVTRCMA